MVNLSGATPQVKEMSSLTLGVTLWHGEPECCRSAVYALRRRRGFNQYSVMTHYKTQPSVFIPIMCRFK